MHGWRGTLGVALALAAAPPLAAQQVTVSGQVRPRTEYRDSASLGQDAFTTMRVRGAVTAQLARHVSAFIQLQDVRTFGEETGPLVDYQADHFDLHQGYLEVGTGGHTDLRARVGRQEIAIGNQRLVGAEDWAQQGRSFDGARVLLDASHLHADLFAIQLSDQTAPTATTNAGLFGVNGEFGLGGWGTLETYGFFNRDTDAGTKQYTLGGRWWGRGGALAYDFEGAYQTGDRTGSSVRAYLLSGMLGAVFGDSGGRIALAYDYLSGDDNPLDATIRTFSTLFATNHGYYGLGDYFTDIPTQTANRGLQDLMVKTAVRIHSAMTLRLDGHQFRVAQSAGMTTARLGEEADFTAVYRYSTNLRLVAGATRLFVGPGFQEIGRYTEDQSWLYAMLDLAF